jgi:2',3'-cyclic-nucleotide 2'-phosphodiesterase (5'-nucleotidase family)
MPVTRNSEHPPLTRKDVLTELPFGNVTVILGLSGTDLKAALENGVSRVEDVAGRFPQVSGVTFTFDRNQKAGSRVSNVMVGGSALDMGKVYKVATNDYIAGGGDGYAALKKGKMLIDKSAATHMATMVMNYISAKGTAGAKVSGRITEK